MRCPTPYRVSTEYRRAAVPCGKRRCPECGRVWLGDARQVICAAMGTLTTSVAVLTITAPGVDVLPWDETGRRCREPELTAWNDTAPGRWSAWWRWCSQGPRARARRNGATWGMLAKVWETQKRGALHLHVIVPYGTPAEREATDELVRNLDGSRQAFGFGYVDRGAMQRDETGQRVRKLVPVAAERAAGYVAKYLTETGKGAQGMGALAATTVVAGPLLYTAQRLTALSGKTMRSMRARRAIYATYRMIGSGIGAWQAATLVHAVEARRPPLTVAARLTLIRDALAGQWGSVVDVRTGELIVPTPAPVPWELRAEDVPQARWSARGATRLDCVWHPVFASTPWGPVRTVVGTVRSTEPG